MKKFYLSFILFLCIFLLVGCNDKKEPVKEEEPGTQETTKKLKIAYIPLDNRPCNVDRMIYGAGSMGFEILMPEEDLYRTALDGQPLNSNHTQYGDRIQILQWLSEANVDAYVISLDQIFSGGLANSRSMDNTNISVENGILDSILQIVGDKPCMFYDTVMRLASTSGYMGLTLKEYSAFRNYALQARPVLNNPTIEEIAGNYHNASYNTYGLTEAQITKYIHARERKLRLADYFLSSVQEKDNIYTFFGIDDSTPNVSIQTNEINYITQRIQHGCIFAGTDELSLMSLGRLASSYYNHRVLTKVSYFGGTESQAGDVYDNASVISNVSKHIEGLNGLQIQIGNPELQILVLTRPSDSKASTFQSEIERLLGVYHENIEKKIPTIIVDVSSYAWHGPLAQELAKNDTDFGGMISYSNWNTVGNTIGLAFSLGIGRMCYLYSNPDKESLDYSYIEYAKSQSFSYIKDMVYKLKGNELMNEYLNQNIVDENGNLVSNATGNYYPYLAYNIDPNTKLLEVLNSTSNTVKFDQILEILNQTCFIYSIENKKMIMGEKLSIEITNLRLPYYRAFEMTFDISIQK